MYFLCLMIGGYFLSGTVKTQSHDSNGQKCSELDSPMGSISSSFVKYMVFRSTRDELAANVSCKQLGGSLTKVSKKMKQLNEFMKMTNGECDRNLLFTNESNYFMSAIRIGDQEVLLVSDCTDKSSQDDTNVDMGIHNKLVCEVGTNQNCSFTTILQGEATLHMTNATVCQTWCKEDDSCEAVLTFANALCIKIVFPGFGARNVTIERKSNCVDQNKNKGTTSPENNKNCYVPFTRTCTPELSYPPIFVSTTTITQMTTEPIYVTKTITYTSTDYGDVQSAVESSNVDTINTVDAISSKSTSKYRRSLTSAHHDTMTSRVVGFVAIISVVTPVVLIILSDIMTLYQHIQNNKVANNNML